VKCTLSGMYGTIWTECEVHVDAIRKALGDGQFGNRCIANIKGRGYSFVGTVVPLAGSTGADVGCLAASSVWTAVRAIANCGWSRFTALTV
jgi:hypothetical protein